MPKRIQRSRKAGWKMPGNTIYVGRPTIYGNPFEANVTRSAADCVKRYEELTVPHLVRQNLIKALRGKDLACWCDLDSPCHADVLLKIANEGDE